MIIDAPNSLQCVGMDEWRKYLPDLGARRLISGRAWRSLNDNFHLLSFILQSLPEPPASHPSIPLHIAPSTHSYPWTAIFFAKKDGQDGNFVFQPGRHSERALAKHRAARSPFDGPFAR